MRYGCDALFSCDNRKVKRPSVKEQIHFPLKTRKKGWEWLPMSPVNEVSRNKGKTKLRDAPIPSLSKTNFDQKASIT